eukprot:1160104-Pelagomonas_calceolata.AAC.19
MGGISMPPFQEHCCEVAWTCMQSLQIVPHNSSSKTALFASGLTANADSTLCMCNALVLCIIFVQQPSPLIWYGCDRAHEEVCHLLALKGHLSLCSAAKVSSTRTQGKSTCSAAKVSSMRTQGKSTRDTCSIMHQHTKVPATHARVMHRHMGGEKACK